MGPQAAERALTEALSAGSATERSAVVATGFCAGLAPGMRPGDVVVAEATRDHRRGTPPSTLCRDNGPLLRARGNAA